MGPGEGATVKLREAKAPADFLSEKPRPLTLGHMNPAWDDCVSKGNRATTPDSSNMLDLPDYKYPWLNNKRNAPKNQRFRQPEEDLATWPKESK